MSRSLKKGADNSETVSRPTTSNTVNRPTASNTVNRPSSSNTVSRPTTSNTVNRPSASNTVNRPGSTTQHEVTSGRVDAPVGKGQWITNSEPEHEVTSGRVDAPVGKGQYITDSSIEITDKGTCDVAYTLVVKDCGPRVDDVKRLLGVSLRSNVKIPYRLSGDERYKANLIELAANLLQAGADIDFTKDIIISFPLI